MRSNKYTIARLHDKVTFGHEGKGKRNPNTGKAMPAGVVADITVHCGNYTMSANQTITAAGSTIQDSVVLVVRHNPKLYKYKVAKYSGDDYTVSNWNKDTELLAYDLVTLTKKQTHA